MYSVVRIRRNNYIVTCVYCRWATNIFFRLINSPLPAPPPFRPSLLVQLNTVVKLGLFNLIFYVLLIPKACDLPLSLLQGYTRRRAEPFAVKYPTTDTYGHVYQYEYRITYSI